MNVSVTSKLPDRKPAGISEAGLKIALLYGFEMLHVNLFCVSLSVKVSQEQTGMALRKQLIKDASDMPCESRQIDRNTQEDEAVDDRDDKVENREH